MGIITAQPLYNGCKAFLNTPWIYNTWHMALIKCWQLFLSSSYFTFGHTFWKGGEKGVSIQCFLSPCPWHYLLAALSPCSLARVVRQLTVTAPQTATPDSAGPRQTACLPLGTSASLELLQPPGSAMPDARIGSFLSEHWKALVFPVCFWTLVAPGAASKARHLCLWPWPLEFPSKLKCPQRALLWSCCWSWKNWGHSCWNLTHLSSPKGWGSG